MRTAIYTYGERVKCSKLANAVIDVLQPIHGELEKGCDEEIIVRFQQKPYIRRGKLNITIGFNGESMLSPQKFNILKNALFSAKRFDVQEITGKLCEETREGKASKYVEFVATYLRPIYAGRRFEE